MDNFSLIIGNKVFAESNYHSHIKKWEYKFFVDQNLSSQEVKNEIENLLNKLLECMNEENHKKFLDG